MSAFREAQSTVRELEDVTKTGKGLDDAISHMNQEASHMTTADRKNYQEQVNTALQKENLLPELSLIYAKDHQSQIGSADGVSKGDLYAYKNTNGNKLNFLENEMVDNLRTTLNDGQAGGVAGAGDSWVHSPLQSIKDTFSDRKDATTDDITAGLKPMIEQRQYVDVVGQLADHPDKNGSLFGKLALGESEISKDSLNKALERPGYLSDDERQSAEFIKEHYSDFCQSKWGGLRDGNITQDSIDALAQSKLGKPAGEIAADRAVTETSTVNDNGKVSDSNKTKGETSDAAREEAARKAADQAFNKLIEMSKQDPNEGPWSVARRLLPDADAKTQMQLTHLLKKTYQEETGDHTDSMKGLHANRPYINEDNIANIMKNCPALRKMFHDLTMSLVRIDDRSSDDYSVTIDV